MLERKPSLFKIQLILALLPLALAELGGIQKQPGLGMASKRVPGLAMNCPWNSAVVEITVALGVNH